mmetsp:Transcript_12882/g.39801  ORF Transcript_12882/g.39801 Transcript_12882/m.39801 type:complete len:638 (-) Transcript_12882:169-2082(-)
MGGHASRPVQRQRSARCGHSACCWTGWLGREMPDLQAASQPGAAHAAPSPDSARPAVSAEEGREILRAVLEIEQCCLGSGTEAGEAAAASPVEDLSVDCMLDEPDKRYFLCSSLSSPIVIACFWLRFDDVYLEDIRLALTGKKERQLRDADSEYQVLRGADAGDPTEFEEVSYVFRVPWPFSDREVLQRRWQLPLGGPGEGLAVVMRSFDDDALFPRRQDRVRAVVHKAAYMLRPLRAPVDGAKPAGTQVPGGSAASPTEACRQAEDSPGLEFVVCQQIDIGGLCPAWAQRFLTRFAVQSGVEWSKKLREHCITMHRRRAGELPDGTEQEATPTSQGRLASKGRRARYMTGQEVLKEILAIERHCCDAQAGAEQGVTLSGFATPSDDSLEKEEMEREDVSLDEAASLAVEVLLDEPSAKYCLCGGLDSPVVIGYIRVLLADVYPGDVWRALVATEERLMRDPQSEYEVLRKAQIGDPTCEEDISFVWRMLWPFCDREVLQRRWTFPLRGGEGLAIVTRSIEDEALLPPREDRVRAFVHRCGYLLRPLERGRPEQLAEGDPAWGGGAGLELTVCQQVDLGGLCPGWAQEVLTRWAVGRGLSWAEELREHCLAQHRTRAARAGEPAEPAPEPAPEAEAR